MYCPRWSWFRLLFLLICHCCMVHTQKVLFECRQDHQRICPQLTSSRDISICFQKHFNNLLPACQNGLYLQQKCAEAFYYLRKNVCRDNYESSANCLARHQNMIPPECQGRSIPKRKSTQGIQQNFQKTQNTANTKNPYVEQKFRKEQNTADSKNAYGRQNLQKRRKSTKPTSLEFIAKNGNAYIINSKNMVSNFYFAHNKKNLKTGIIVRKKSSSTDNFDNEIGALKTVNMG